MTARTPLPVSDDSLPEAPSPFFDDEDEEALSAFCNEVKMAMRGNFLEGGVLYFYT